ncbi:MAG TPA: EF-Tu/IF-2/RF-3 family GTPase, partial [Alphaproteobacteria bacterium]|nr:EF-Tu/IF-2/RF-3 family GTPase [Alphaproteobacteria bacterium]
AKLQTGRGAVATILVQKGTFRVGDIIVTGAESGRIRAMHDDHGKNIKEAGPGKPVEIIGLTAVPNAGDDFIVVENETKAREIAEFRLRKRRELLNLATKKNTLENMFSDIKTGARKELAIIVKGDVHGSVEAIASTLLKVSGESTEVSARIIHTGVGAINESDITLANASKALVVGFNVRANPQARDLARRDGIEIRYYSVIYDIMDDVKQMLSGMLAPTLRENFLGNAEIRQVINITKVGKVAGCMVTDGLVKRGAKVRLLRDDVVIHDGTLKTLKRFKDEVREVKEGFECGMAFENYEDIRVGDKIEAYEMESISREL